MAWRLTTGLQQLRHHGLQSLKLLTILIPMSLDGICNLVAKGLNLLYLLADLVKTVSELAHLMSYILHTGLSDAFN